MTFLRRLVALTISFLALSFGLAYAEQYTVKDLQDLAMSSPTLEQFDGAKAAVWQYQNVYAFDKASRQPQRLVSYVVLASGDMDASWLNADLIAPQGGSLLIEQAAWMELGGTELHPVSASTEEGITTLDWPVWSGAPRLLVLRYIQTLKPDAPLSGMFEPRLAYPVWDASLRVLVEEGDNLFYYNSHNQEPLVREEQGSLWYGWHYASQPPALGKVGIVADADPFTLFSFETGTGQVQLTMDKLQSYDGKGISLGIKPSDSPKKIADALDAFWASGRRGSLGLFREQAYWKTPQTQMEAVAVMVASLKSAGFNPKVWWESKVPMNKEMPNCVFTLSRPVIDIAKEGEKTGWLYVPGQTDQPGKTPEIISGRVLFQQRGDKLIQRTYGAGRVSANRLTAHWDLTINDKGYAEGTLSLRAKGRWRAVVTNGQHLELEHFPTLNDWITDGGESTKDDDSITLNVPVEKQIGVLAQGDQMVAWLPTLQVDQLELLKALQGEINLSFPFVVEQTYDVKLPSALKPLDLPRPGNTGGGVVNYSVTQRFNNAKHKITAEEKLVVKPTSIKGSESADFGQILELWGQWGRVGLPLVKK